MSADRYLFALIKRIGFPFLIILITASFLILPANMGAAEGGCGECPNPLVRIMNVIVAGEIPDFEEWGYMEVKPGRQGRAYDSLWRGLTVFTGFKKKNPCADLYFIYEDIARTKRVGVKEGEAKYKVETIVEFLSVEDGLVTPVKEVIGIQTELDEPVIHNGVIYRYDYDIISKQDKLVPVTGQIDVTTNLVCLKNSQTYDFKNLLIDRIDDPYDYDEDMLGKECPDYYMPDGPVTDEDGQVHIPAEGLMFGKFSPSDLSAFSIEFEKGDIGEIIRKTETPKNCKIKVDHKTDYPPFYILDVTNITNEYGKKFPNNIYIALKADKGRLEGGKFMDGWRVYPTNDGKVTEKIQYTPPQCAISESDIIKIAQVCDYHDGPMSVGSTKFTKKIHNPLCFDATITMTSRHLKEKTLDRTETIENDNFVRRSEYIEDRSGTITLQLEKHSEINHAMFGEHWVYYMSKSRSLDSWHIEYHDHRDERRESNVSNNGMDMKIREDAEISNVKLRTPDVPMMVIVFYDTATKKAKRVMVQASFDIGYKMRITKTNNTEMWHSGHSETRNDEETKTKNGSYKFHVAGDAVLDPKLKKKFPSGCLVSGGDGKTLLTGYGQTDVTKPVSNNKYFDDERDLKTFQWSMTINEKKKK